MIVLGIADNHDSGAAVMIHNGLVSAVNQERVDRVKGSAAFPWGAIDAALDAADVSAREVDRVVVGTGFTPSAPLRLFPERHEAAREGGQFSPLMHAYVAYQSAMRASGLHTLDVDLSRQILKRKLRARRFTTEQVELVDHHRAHAQAAYRTQAYPDALVLTVDAMGDGTTVTVSRGNHGQLDLLYRQSGFSAINAFYGRITELLGFTANRHEGKVMGLAARAAPPEALLIHLRSKLRFSPPGFSRSSLFRPERRTDPFWREVERYDREQIAAAAQQVLEESVVAFARHWLRETGARALAVAGGTFANVKLNQRIAELDELDELWVLPHMGDGGLAVGGLMCALEPAPRQIPDVYWGPGFSEKLTYKALSLAELPRVKRPDVIERVADLLGQGKTVARFDGRMEWGPRALGNRSILLRADDVGLTDRLNDQLGRNDFMPFAPIVREEDAPNYFKNLAKADDSARFMTVCFTATPRFRQLAPAAVHVDGTARPQVVRAADNPALHALLGAVGERTGSPVLINTSFNIHEEPIVATPGDAVRTWRAAELDALWLGPFLVDTPAPR